MPKQLVDQFREWAKARRNFLIGEVMKYDVLTGRKLDILVNRDLEKYRALPKYKEKAQTASVAWVEGAQTAEDIELTSIAYLNEIEVLDQVIASYNNACANKPISDIMVFMDILITYARDYQVEFEDAAQLLGMLIYTNGAHNISDYFSSLGKCFTATGNVNIKDLDNASFASNFLMTFSQVLLEESLRSESDFNEIKVRNLMKYYLNLANVKSAEDIKEEPKLEEKSIKKVETNMLRDYYKDGVIVNVCYDIDMFTKLLKEADKSNAEIKKLSKMMKSFTTWLDERETTFYKAKEYLNEEELAILNYLEDFLSSSSIKDETYYTVKAAVEGVMSPIIFAYNTSCDSELTEELNDYIKEEVEKEMQELRGVYQLFREESVAKNKLSYPKNSKALSGLFKSLENMNENEYKSATILMQQLGEEMSLKPCDIGLIDEQKLSLVANDSSIIVYTIDTNSNTFKVLGIGSTEAGIDSMVKTIVNSASLQDDLKPEEQLKDEEITKNVFNGLNEKGQELKYKKAE